MESKALALGNYNGVQTLVWATFQTKVWTPI
jgi:hypothetical protein